jgi:hypothetical protein
VLETEETFFRVMNEEDRRACSETGGIDEVTKVIEKQSLSQHPDDSMNITVSPNRNAS